MQTPEKVTAGGETESMAGIDLVNLRQSCKTNCITQSRELGQTQTGREGGRGGGVEVMMNEREGWNAEGVYKMEAE